MKKTFLGLAFSCTFLSILFLPTNNDNVHATVISNRADLTTKTVGKAYKKLPLKNDSKVVEPKITSARDLKNYLQEKYPMLKTDIVTVKFNYSVIENDSVGRPYDFFIDYNLSFKEPYVSNFDAAMNTRLDSIKHQNTAKDDVAKAKKQFNDFIESMAKDVIEKLPNKKILGQDYDDWYTYSYIREGWNLVTTMSWTNYEPINIGLTWPGPQPKDYSMVTNQISKNYNQALAAQYRNDEKMRNDYRSKYKSLNYNDFEITEFGWRTYLDNYNYSKY